MRCCSIEKNVLHLHHIFKVTGIKIYRYGNNIKEESGM